MVNFMLWNFYHNKKKLTQEEAENLNSPIIIKEIGNVI